MGSKRFNKVMVFILSDIIALQGEIEERFNRRFAEKAGDELSWANHYFNYFCRAKIDTEVNRMSQELTRQAIELREDNWEGLLDYLKENFDTRDAQFLINSFKKLAEREKEKYILTNKKNPFKKSKVIKQAEIDMKESI